MAIAPRLLQTSRILRKKQTPWEKKLWKHLRAGRFKGLKFKRQVVIGDYIVDCCCFEKRLVIELDGGQHAEDQIQNPDIERQKFLESRGYTVLRFWNNEIENDLESVLERIRQVIEK